MAESKKKLKRAAEETAAPDTKAEETAVSAEDDSELANSEHESSAGDTKDSKENDKKSDAAPDEEDGALGSFLNRKNKEKTAGKVTDIQKKLIILVLVAAAVGLLIFALVTLRKQPVATIEDSTYTPADITLSINEDGVHEAIVTLDEDGNIKQNGDGTLLTYATKTIKEIDLENESGSYKILSYTPEGEATVYTVVGFEDYDLEGSFPGEIASHSAVLSFSKIISVNADLADYGLDKPRAKVNVLFSDGTSEIIRVGDNAPSGSGAYLSFGSIDTVYLVNISDISPFLYSINDLISCAITETVLDGSLLDFSALKISGTHYAEPIVLEPNHDDAVGFSYIVTSPRNMFAGEVESHDITGDIRGLYGESVVCINPSADQLKDYGLDKPYATVEASYPDTDITLHTSSPRDDGTVYVYNPQKKIIYSIQLAAVSWAKTSLDLLTPENPLNIRMAYVDTISFSAGSTSFTLDISTTTEDIVDDSGIEQHVIDTTAAYNGKDLEKDNFNIFFQNLNGIKNLGYPDGSAGSKVMSVTFGYTTGRSDDTLSVYAGDTKTYILEFNGDVIGTVSKKYIDSLINGAQDLIKGDAVESL